MRVPSRTPASTRSLAAAVVALAVVVAAALPVAPNIGRANGTVAVDHLVVSEVVTGGASASDELIELHNPTAAPLPLEGLELVYVTASGATISRRAAWAVGAPSVPAGGHVLVANQGGIYASIADALYASGMAATGGSVALRIQGASWAIDAVGWGTAVSTWLEGTPVAAPLTGASIERLPGGSAGSGQDSDDNAADFVERAEPEPQNLASEPTPGPGTSPSPAATPSPGMTASPLPSPTDGTPGPSPSPTPSPPLTPTPSASPSVSSSPSATPAPTVVPIADARAAADGATVTIEGVALTGSTFHDGGGFVADASGGIAVLPDGDAFERGQLLRVTGSVDDRFSQRTLRPAAGDLVVLGSGEDPSPTESGTASIDEALEGRLVRVSGTVAGSPTELTAALAFDLDDGSGPVRVVVGAATGIATSAWTPGATVQLVGVVGQRDSTGSGTEGYRLMPRVAADVLAVLPPASPTPQPSDTEPTPSATPDPEAGAVVTIAEARAADVNARVRVRGVVTLPSGLVDERTAVVQDGTAAILLRLTGAVGDLALGARVEAGGMRSTLAGMESLRVTADLERLGTAAQPAPLTIGTGAVSEAREALLVVVRGAIVATPRRSSSGSVSFDIDDGSGPLRVSAASGARIEREPLVAGAWVEVTGVLGQETTRAEPNAGYRIWPRTIADIRVVAPATGTGSGQAGAGGGAPRGGGGATLDDIGTGELSRLRVGATLVIGRWKELGVAGLLWDGKRLVAVHAASGPIVDRLTRGRRPPLPLELSGLQAAGIDPHTGSARVRLGSAPSDALVLDAAPAPARGELDGTLPAWVSVIGRPSGPASNPALVVGDARVPLEIRCDAPEDARRALATKAVRVTGVAVADPLRLLVPCSGVRAAPTLAGFAAGSRPPVAGSPAPQPTTAGLTTPVDPRRSAAAVVLLLGAASLATVAWLRRRRGGAVAGDEPVDGDQRNGELAGEVATVPRLTLVRVRNKHGPRA